MEEDEYVIIDFEDIDTKKISFGKPRTDNRDGISVHLYYNGVPMFVRYRYLEAPFGLGTSTRADGSISGYNLPLSLSKDLDNRYLKKAKEIDNFFIEKCTENSISWGFSNKPLSRDEMAGREIHGHDGLWKRMLKYSSKVISGVRTYTTFPPRLEFAVPTDEDGYLYSVFDKNCASIPLNAKDEGAIAPFTIVNVIANWGYLHRGPYGASLKPRIRQLRIFDREKNTIPTNRCLLD